MTTTTQIIPDQNNISNTQNQKDIFLLENFLEESRDIVEEYKCQICSCISLNPILLGKKNHKKNNLS